MDSVFCCTQKETFPTPRSHEHNTAQQGRAFGASVEICQIQQGIWEHQAFHFGGFYENQPMSLCCLCTAPATAPLAGPLHLWLVLSDLGLLDSLKRKYLHTSKRISNSSCFNDLFPKSVMILPFLSKCCLDSIPSWLFFVVKSCFWFLSLIFHSHS